MSLPLSNWIEIGPWTTQFNVAEGLMIGGSYDAAGDIRLKQFQETYPLAKSILELGSLEGGHSFALASLPRIERVVALEGREDNLTRARFIQEHLPDRITASKVTFQQANLEIASLTDLGKFDVVFCVGLLYHLPAPWKLLKELRKVTNNLFIWTHYTDLNCPRISDKYYGLWYKEYGLKDPLSGLSNYSFWPMKADLFQMLSDCDFPNTSIISEEVKNGSSAITLTAKS
jgi:SAM-dependent methyltransferase